MNNTLAQKRSAFALESIMRLTGNRKDFAKLTAGLPAMILQNGFGQTLAFLLAKGTNKDLRIEETNKHIQAFDIMICWLKEQKILPDASRPQEIKTLSELDQGRYLYAQEEAMKVLEWVKRYANAGLFSE